MPSANKTAFVLICVIVVMTTLAYGTVHQPTIALFYIGVAALVILWSIDGLKSGMVRFSNSWLQIPLLAAAVYGLIQVIPLGSVTGAAGVSGIPRMISLDPASTQVNAIHFLFLFFFAAVTFALIDSASRIARIAALITVFGTVYAFYAILQSVLSPDKIYGIYERAFASPFGSFVSRHNFAAYMEMTIAIPLGMMFAGAVPRDRRLLYGTAIALMGTALLLSGSRGGFVALIAEVALMTMLTLRSGGVRAIGTKIALAAILLITIIGGSLFVGGESSLTRVAETQNAGGAASIDRSYIWGVTLEMIRSNMPFGVGLGAYGVAFTQLDTHNGTERVEQAHNDYLQITSDAGLVGLLIGGFFLFTFYKVGREAIAVENTFRRGIAVGAVSGIFAILVHSAFDFVLHTTAISVLFIMLLALVTASRRSYEDDSSEDERPHNRRGSRGTVAAITSGRRSTSNSK
ncbi:MAG: O-antigen ligase family protein [Acidobacteriota bacterium]